jgi:hypothetical protein
VWEHNKLFVETVASIPQTLKVYMRPTNRSGESNFGRAKKELSIYNVNLRALVIESKLLLKQFSPNVIEKAFDLYWKEFDVMTRARKMLDACPQKKVLQLKRWEEKQQKLVASLCAEEKNRLRRNLELATKAYLVSKGIIGEKDKLTNTALLDCIMQESIHLLQEAPKRMDLLEALFPTICQWTQGLLERQSRTIAVNAQFSLEQQK